MTTYPNSFKPKRSMIVHMVGDDKSARLPEGEVASVRTRCGRTIDRPVVTANVGPTRYDLIARNGNQFFCSTQPDMITCVKCRNLLTVGTIYAPKPTRSTNAQKRTVETSRAASARTARTHARPRA